LVNGHDAATRAASSIRSVVAAASPLSKVTAVQSMSDLIRRSTTEQRFRTTLVDLFGSLAVLLAAIGLYGLAARLVTHRMHEAGVRIALGATVASVSTLMAARVLALVAAGLVIVLALAFPLTQTLKPYLFGVTDRDPGSYIATVTILSAVALAASILPTRRLRRVSPTSVLSSD